jgi:signal transduction histidine kinase
MKMMFHSLDLKFPENDPRTTDAKIMGEKIEHLNKIVEQILDFARTTEPELKPVNVNQIVDELGLLIRHKLTNHDIALERHLEPNLPALMADATQLEQVFLNLTLNAVEAMPDGGTLTLVTRSQRAPMSSREPTYVVIEFKDTGAGMTEEQRLRAFTSLLNTTKPKGTGLGLAIVNKVVEAHRGKIKVKSRVGYGTTISIILPV